MSSLSRAFTRRNIIAIAAGVLLAGVPFVAFDFWLGGVIDRQAQDEVATSAKRAIALAESRVSQTMRALDALAHKGVKGCGPQDIEAMRRAAFKATPVKEIDVIGPAGQTLVQPSRPPGRPNAGVLSTRATAGSEGYFIDIVRLASGGTMVRLRRKAAAAGNALAALVPTCFSCRRSRPAAARSRAMPASPHAAAPPSAKLDTCPKAGAAACVRRRRPPLRQIRLPAPRWLRRADRYRPTRPI